jgi:hypothetical protein
LIPSWILGKTQRENGGLPRSHLIFEEKEKNMKDPSYKTRQSNGIIDPVTKSFQPQLIRNFAVVDEALPSQLWILRKSYDCSLGDK